RFFVWGNPRRSAARLRSQTVEFYPGMVSASILQPSLGGDFAALGSDFYFMPQNAGMDIPISQIGSNSNLTFCGSTCMWVAWTPNYYPLVWLNVDTIQQGSYP